MFRTASGFCVCLALSAWAGAQEGHAPRPTAAELLHMLQADRSLLSNLLDDGLDLAKAGTALERAEGSRRAARSLANALARAAEEQDADRVVEFGGHLESVVRDALAPALEEARRTTPDESPEAVRVKDLARRAGDDLDAVRATFPPDGKLVNHEGVKEVRVRLNALRERLR